MSQSVQARDTCASYNREPTEKKHARRCTNAQQLRRDCTSTSTRHLISVGTVYGWIHHKFMPGTLGFPQRCTLAVNCEVIEMLHKTVGFRVPRCKCG